MPNARGRVSVPKLGQISLLGGSGSGSGGLRLLVLSLVGSLLLLEVLGEELLVGLVGLAGSLPRGELALLVVGLSAEALVGDDALDLGGLVEGLVALLDLAADNVLGDIVLLAESESLSDLASPLGTESARLLVISEAGNLTGALLENLEGKDAKVGAGDAASDGLTLALTSSFGAVGLDSCNQLVIKFKDGAFGFIN